MRASEQFISFVNFIIAILCLFFGAYLLLVCSVPSFYEMFFLYLSKSIKFVGIIFFLLGIVLLISLRFQEGKKGIRLKTTISTFDIDKKILQQKAIKYFHDEKKLKDLSLLVKINQDQILEVNIQSKLALKTQDFEQFEKDLKKIFAEIGYYKKIYLNYTQPS